MTPAQLTLLRRAITTFGEQEQWDMVQEECAELTVEISHARRGQDNATEIVEEVADVYIMITQARLMLGEQLVDNIVEQKLQRLKQRLDKSEAYNALMALRFACKECRRRSHPHYVGADQGTWCSEHVDT